MVLDDRRLKVRVLVDLTDISKSALHRMLIEKSSFVRMVGHFPQQCVFSARNMVVTPPRNGGKRFGNNEEVVSAVDSYFEMFDSSHYKHGIKAIILYMELKEDYFEKKTQNSKACS